MSRNREVLELWSFELDRPAAEVAALRTLLSPDECARADRLRVHPERFIVGRARLRQILAARRACRPEALVFRVLEHGKPELVPCGELRFNLSHTAERAILALAPGREVGCDIEDLRRSVSFDALAQRFFSEPERAALAGMDDLARRRAFFTIWTRKEAYLKARGGGISLGLSHFTVLGGAGPDGWSILDVAAPEGFAAAVCVAGEALPVRLRTWGDDGPDPEPEDRREFSDSGNGIPPR